MTSFGTPNKKFTEIQKLKEDLTSLGNQLLIFEDGGWEAYTATFSKLIEQENFAEAIYRSLNWSKKAKNIKGYLNPIDNPSLTDKTARTANQILEEKLHSLYEQALKAKDEYINIGPCETNCETTTFAKIKPDGSQITTLKNRVYELLKQTSLKDREPFQDFFDYKTSLKPNIPIADYPREISNLIYRTWDLTAGWTYILYFDELSHIISKLSLNNFDEKYIKLLKKTYLGLKNRNYGAIYFLLLIHKEFKIEKRKPTLIETQKTLELLIETLRIFKEKYLPLENYIERALSECIS